VVAALALAIARLQRSGKFNNEAGAVLSGLSLYSLLLSARLAKWNLDSVYTLRAAMGNDDIGQVTLMRMLAILSQNFTVLAEKSPVTVIRSVKYGDAPPNSYSKFLRTFAWEGQTMDLYLPERQNGTDAVKMPIFFYVHGGGWVTGDKTFASLPMLYQVASAGWLVVSVNYRLSGPGPKDGVAFPAHLVDIKRALACVRAEGGIADTYGGNKNLVVCSGESAGGHLSSLLALTQNEPEYQPGFKEADTSIQGCVDLYGVHDFNDSQGHQLPRDDGNFQLFMRHVVMKKNRKNNPEEYEKASPLSRLRSLTSEDVPPFFVAIGSHDSLVAVSDNKDFMETIKAKRAPTSASVVPDRYVQLFGAQHAFNYLVSPRTIAFGDAVVDFISEINLHQSTSKL
jgi:acetyl esterase/lipase